MKFKTARSILIIAFVLSLLLWVGGTKGWAESFSMDSYRSMIDESIERLESREGNVGQEEINWFENRFGEALTVRTRNGEEVVVDRMGFRHWLSQARDSSEGRKKLLAHLRALSHQLSLETEGNRLEGVNWKDSRNLLDDVYRSKEFRHLVVRKTPAWKAFLQKSLQALTRWLKEHLPSLGAVSGRWIQYLIYGLILLLGAILIVWIVDFFGPVGWRWKDFGTTPSIRVDDSAERDWEEWRARANQKALDGAFREAIRLLFISALVEGHQRDWWSYESETTNKEHLGRVEGQTERREALRSLIELYEKTWYGLGQPGREEFLHCEQLVQRMEATA